MAMKKTAENLSAARMKAPPWNHLESVTHFNLAVKSIAPNGKHSCS
jgi:hypothetical protein